MKAMTKVKSILREARQLSAAGLAKLLSALLHQQAENTELGESLAAQRGLLAWTGSRRHED
jgi:hypothetical protein